MIFWGLSFVATKIALETVPVFTLVFFRFGIAAVFFLGIALWKGFPRFSKKDHLFIFLMALFEPGLYFIFETIGLQYTSAPKAALIIATVPIAVSIFAAIILKERTGIVGFLGICFSFTGIYILITGDPGFSWSLDGSFFGDVLILGAVITASLYTVFARKLGQRNSALAITSIQIFYGVLFYLPAFIWEFPGIEWGMFSGRSVAAFIYLAVFATFAAFLCYNYSLTRLPASSAAIFVNFIPVVTALGAWFLLGEFLSNLQIFGGAIVLLSIFVTNIYRVKKKV